MQAWWVSVMLYLWSYRSTPAYAIFHIIALLWNNQRAITLFCTNKASIIFFVMCAHDQKCLLCTEASFITARLGVCDFGN